MTNVERIRTMSDEELNTFLWWFKIDAVSNFFESGGRNIMNANQQKEWLKSDDYSFIDKLMNMGKVDE